MKRIGVDVGGTFTDLIYVDDEAGVIRVHKLPTTPDDPSQGTIQGVKELADAAGAEPSSLDQVFHGTTIATNIVIEHNGARVGMLTTASVAKATLQLVTSSLTGQVFDIKRHEVADSDGAAPDGPVLGVPAVGRH